MRILTESEFFEAQKRLAGNHRRKGTFEKAGLGRDGHRRVYHYDGHSCRVLRIRDGATADLIGFTGQHDGCVLFESVPITDFNRPDGAQT